MVKCCHNIFNATKISFWNEMWRVCQRLGLAADDIATTVSRSAEASTNPDYGIRGGAPYGGVCLPKDTKGFLGLAEQIGVPMPLLSAVIQVNDALERLVARELSEAGDPIIELGSRDGLTSDALAPERAAGRSDAHGPLRLRDLHPARGPGPGPLGQLADPAGPGLALPAGQDGHSSR